MLKGKPPILQTNHRIQSGRALTIPEQDEVLFSEIDFILLKQRTSFIISNVSIKSFGCPTSISVHHNPKCIFTLN